MKLDRLRFDRSQFPYRCEIATRFDDLDLLGHVNNVSIGSILQEARCRFEGGFSGVQSDAGERVVAGITIDFAHEVRYPEAVQAFVGVLDVGGRSFRLAQVLRQRGLVCVYAETVLVFRSTSGALAIPDAYAAALNASRIEET